MTELASKFVSATMQSAFYKQRAAGYSLIELQVGVILGAIIVITVLTIMIMTAHMADAMVTQIKFNQEARLIFGMITDGRLDDINGIRNGDPSLIVDTTLIGDSINDTTLTLDIDTSINPNENSYLSLIQSNQLNQLVGFKGSASSNKSSSLNSVTVVCRGNEIPYKRCTGTTSLTIDGYVDQFATSDNMTIAGGKNRTREITFSLIDPYLAGDENYISAEYQQNFRTIIGVYTK